MYTFWGILIMHLIIYAVTYTGRLRRKVILYISIRLWRKSMKELLKKIPKPVIDYRKLRLSNIVSQKW